MGVMVGGCSIVDPGPNHTTASADIDNARKRQLSSVFESAKHALLEYESRGTSREFNGTEFAFYSYSRASLITRGLWDFDTISDALGDGLSLSFGSGFGLFELEQNIAGVDLIGFDLYDGTDAASQLSQVAPLLLETGSFHTADVTRVEQVQPHLGGRRAQVIWSNLSVFSEHLKHLEYELSDEQKQTLARLLVSAQTLLDEGGELRISPVLLDSEHTMAFIILAQSYGFEIVPSKSGYSLSTLYRFAEMLKRAPREGGLWEDIWREVDAMVQNVYQREPCDRPTPEEVITEFADYISASMPGVGHLTLRLSRR